MVPPKLPGSMPKTLSSAESHSRRPLTESQDHVPIRPASRASR